MENIDSTALTFLPELFHQSETVRWILTTFLDFQDEPQVVQDEMAIGWFFSLSQSHLKSLKIEMGTILLESGEQEFQLPNRDDRNLPERGDPFWHLPIGSKRDWYGDVVRTCTLFMMQISTADFRNVWSLIAVSSKDGLRLTVRVR